MSAGGVPASILKNSKNSSTNVTGGNFNKKGTHNGLLSAIYDQLERVQNASDKA